MIPTLLRKHRPARILLAASLLLATSSQALMAQSVIFPQKQQAGTACSLVSAEQDAYTLKNDLLSATFVKKNGKLMFDGCKEMNLLPGTELFKLELGNGTVIKASDMTLASVALEDLVADTQAAKGARRLPGKAIKATFTKDNLTVEWRAVLRDGSHYLRTELKLVSSKNQSMTSVTPMLYNVDTEAAQSTPAVVGNTRGAVLASDKIFAGLETPMGLNSVGGATGDVENFSAYSWTPESFNWTPGSDTPQGITKLGYATSEIVGARGYLAFHETGDNQLTFNYASGTHRINVAGVDLVDPATGEVVASDYHYGYSGNLKDKNTYTLHVPEAKIYMLRYFIEVRTETITSSGKVAFDKQTSVPVIVYDLAPSAQVKQRTPSQNDTGVTDTLHLARHSETPIEGLWSRSTTLAAGTEWSVSSVVGLVAPGQARRSFLAYSERERAVPWRPFPLYNSWYELNIDRNNAAPPTYTGNMTVAQCTNVVKQWKTNFYDKYQMTPQAFVWDDGWDEYGTWTFNCNFPNGFKEPSVVTDAMGAGIGAWLGPVGGYGTSGSYRRSYWSSKGGMQLSNKDYYQFFIDACTKMIDDYDFRFFKFDGISAQFSSVGPDAGATGVENAEAVINVERDIRKRKDDIFLNTTVGTWASPFWFQFTDAVWRQEGDYGTVGNQGTDREKWITYRDRLVYQNFVQNSPLCPINTLMTHGVILTNFGAVAKNMNYDGIVREIRCAFACGSGMVELYCDYSLLNSIKNNSGQAGALWGDIAECMQWQVDNQDVLPDSHWVGGNPWDGSKANVYGWASWNGTKAVLTLRNPQATAQTFKTTLRKALDIPAYINTSITLSDAFTQGKLTGLSLDTPIDIDTELTLSLPGSTVFVFNGKDNNPSTPTAITEANRNATLTANKSIYDLAGRRLAKPTFGINIVDGKKVLNTK